MHDLTAFDRQIAEEFMRDAGPSEAVDDAAIFAAIAAARSRRRTFQTMFGAAKWVVVTAIVALFGGFLITQQSDQALPVGASPSPSPQTSDDPLAGLVTERVAPGVLRVVRDDAGHDLASLGVVEVALGPDGAVWMDGRSGLFRLREPGIGDGESRHVHRTWLTVGPDGSVWSNGAWERRDRSVRSFDGERWIYYPGPVGASGLRNDQLVPPFAIGPDGSVWGVWVNGPQPPGFELARLEDRRWVVVDLTGWPDDMIGNANAVYGPGLVATDDGSLWLVGGTDDRDSRRTALSRFDGRGWDVITIPRRVTGDLQLAAGPDGSLWVFGIDGESTARMARYTDGAWTVVETPPGIRPGLRFNTEDALRPVVTPDGAVWIGRKGNAEALSQTGCDGLLRYDGTWIGYLADHCVHSMAAGPRGEAWVVAGPIDEQTGRPTDTEVYLIDPRASAPDG